MFLDSQTWEVLCANTPTPPKEHPDLLYHNVLVRKVIVEGLGEAVEEMDHMNDEGKSTVGRPPRLGNEPKYDGPLCFYVELNCYNMKAIVVPRELKRLLVDVKKIIMKPTKSHPHPKVCVPIRWSKCCQYFVQL